MHAVVNKTIIDENPWAVKHFFPIRRMSKMTQAYVTGLIG